MKIRGSVALVTGANRGLGLAFANALLAAGASKVCAAARDPSRIDLPGITPIRLDITDADMVTSAAHSCADVNLVINNAGVFQQQGFLGERAAQAAREQFETNFYGTLSMSRAFAPVLAANGGGALVNVLSVLSWFNLPPAGPYSASKAAAWALTNGLRNELQAQKTQVVAVHAAFIDTDMARDVPGPEVQASDVARQTLAAIETGLEEVLADEVTRQIKRGFNAEPPVYLKEASR
jgi:NAD(P)-dependent dehydrogenase (short-subunit alcohol dehydrogenase family)